MLEGKLDFMLGGADAQATPGDLVRLGMGMPHGIFNKSDQTAKVLFWVSPTQKLYDLFWGHSQHEGTEAGSRGGARGRAQHPLPAPASRGVRIVWWAKALLRRAHHLMLRSLHNSLSYPAQAGDPSTPEPLGSITNASGYWNPPPSRAMTAACDSAFSRRDAPEVFITFTLSSNRGRREDRVRAAPAVSCAKCTEESAHEHTGSAEAIRHSLRKGK